MKFFRRRGRGEGRTLPERVGSCRRRRRRRRPSPPRLTFLPVLVLLRLSRAHRLVSSWTVSPAAHRRSFTPKHSSWLPASTNVDEDESSRSLTIVGGVDGEPAGGGGRRMASALDGLAASVATCLVSSDARRDGGWDGASTGWTSWVDGASAVALRGRIRRLRLPADEHRGGRVGSSSSPGWRRQSRWMRWIQSCPGPAQVELSSDLRRAVGETIESRNDYRALFEQQPPLDEGGDDALHKFLQRIGCRLIYLPSGATLSSNLVAAPGAMVYGKLLAGGVTRFRLIGSSGGTKKRRAGERRVVVGKAGDASTHTDDDDDAASWLQYGGPERNYQAVDMGPCLLMEVTLLPIGLELPPLVADNDGDLVMSCVPWDPAQFLQMRVDDDDLEDDVSAKCRNTQSGASATSVCDLESTFCASVGGLQPQIDEIVRRVLDGRVVRSVRETDANNATSTSSQFDKIRREEMEGLLALGLQPVRGLLLYGPPGCGKTALAREISTILDARPPKIVAAPELLDRWVGGTEKLVRGLFAEAEEELRLCNGDPTQSALHVVVIDEIDAVFRRRSASTDSSEVTRASAVNQILSKLDGIQQLPNTLVIGMTNRRELLDPALLRPGRLEVQIEVPLPDRKGRREILKIHFGALRANGRLSQPLCRAIDGPGADEDVYERRSAAGRLASWVSRRFSSLLGRTKRIRDLAADRWTGGFSGADIEGLVRNAGSIALARSRCQGDSGVANLLITLEDTVDALQEIKRV